MTAASRSKLPMPAGHAVVGISEEGPAEVKELHGSNHTESTPRLLIVLGRDGFVANPLPVVGSAPRSLSMESPPGCPSREDPV